jgi:hypothetical protein
MSQDKLIRLALIAAVAGAAVCASSVREDVAQAIHNTFASEAEVTSRPVPATAARALIAKATPASTTNAEEHQAERIVAASGAMAKAFPDTSMTMIRVGYWTTGGYENVSIGATVWVKLGQPVTTEGPWPLAIDVRSHKGRAFYISEVARQRIPSVSEVSVLVDLKRQTVAAIYPLKFGALVRGNASERKAKR